MKNDTRISIFIGYGKAPNISRLFVCLGSLLVLEKAWAEVGLPPPAQHQNAGFPSDQALQRRGYDPKTGVWKVDVQNNGKPTVNKDGGTYNGSQNKTVTVTGKYGETGKMNTTVNQRVGTGRLQTAANTVIVANAVNNSYTKNYAAEAAKAFKNGNYLQAAHNSIMTLGATLDGILGGAIRDIATGIGNGLKEPQQYEQSQRQAEAEGNYQKAVANAAAKKAAEAAAKAKAAQEAAQLPPTKNENGKTKYRYFVRFEETALRMDENGNWVEGCCKYIQWVSGYSDSPIGRYDEGNISNNTKLKEFKYRLKGKDIFLNYKFKFTGQKDYYDMVSISVYDFDSKIPDEATKRPEVNIKDFQLTQQEMLDILKRMLENNQTNHAELMNQLAQMGVMNQSAEPSTFSPDTALSAPYTPEGSSTPQQTRFRMNQDGTVGVDYVPRPDLKPNSPEAPNKPEKTTPSRQESPDTPNSPNTPNQPNNPTGQQNQNQENQKQDFCKQNPNTAQCMPGGDSSYEDIKLPEQTIDLNFKPLDVFQSDGKCPAPRSVDFGALGQVEFSYDPLCDLARKLRPIFIAICVLTCAYFVYESVKEL